MYLCPKCETEMLKSAMQCPRCKNKLKISFKSFERRERKLLESVSKDDGVNLFNRKQDNVKQILSHFEDMSSENNPLFSKFSDKEFMIFKFNLISEIYLNKTQISRKKDLKRIVKKYKGQYQSKPKIVAENLKKLVEIVGFPEFTCYYTDLLNKYDLNLKHGLVVMAYVIQDLISFKFKKQSVKHKINFHLKKYVHSRDKRIRKKLDIYYEYTGKHYFSHKFDVIMEANNFSVKSGFNIKRKVLEDIYTYDYVKIRQRINIYIKEERNKKTYRKNKKNRKDKFNIDKHKRLGGKTRHYNDKKRDEFNVLGHY